MVRFGAIFSCLPIELQKMVISHLCPLDVRAFLTATGLKYAYLFKYFVDEKSKNWPVFFNSVEGFDLIFLSDVEDVDSLTLGEINLVEINDHCTTLWDHGVLPDKLRKALTVIVMSSEDNKEVFDKETYPGDNYELDECDLEEFYHLTDDENAKSGLYEMNGCLPSSQVLMIGFCPYSILECIVRPNDRVTYIECCMIGVAGSRSAIRTTTPIRMEDVGLRCMRVYQQQDIESHFGLLDGAARLVAISHVTKISL